MCVRTPPAGGFHFVNLAGIDQWILRDVLLLNRPGKKERRRFQERYVPGGVQGSFSPPEAGGTKCLGIFHADFSPGNIGSSKYKGGIMKESIHLFLLGAFCLACLPVTVMYSLGKLESFLLWAIGRSDLDHGSPETKEGRIDLEASLSPRSLFRRSTTFPTGSLSCRM